MSAATPAEIARLIDHTRLAADATRPQIEALCDQALDARFAAVCINPVWVALCAERLRGSAVAVCTVVGFPLGATSPAAKRGETRQALADGAREIDTVLHIGAVKSGLLRDALQDLETVVAACREQGALSKVILETALLSDEEKVVACTLAWLAGADFVKTSTGFAAGGATTADVALLRQVVGSSMGIKASGGIRTLDVLREMVAAGATRIGTSAGLHIVRQAGGEHP